MNWGEFALAGVVMFAFAVAGVFLHLFIGTIRGIYQQELDLKKKFAQFKRQTLYDVRGDISYTIERYEQSIKVRIFCENNDAVLPLILTLSDQDAIVMVQMIMSKVGTAE